MKNRSLLFSSLLFSSLLFFLGVLVPWWFNTSVLSVSFVVPSPVPPVANALPVLYAALDAEVAALSPVCEVSGRCCRFKEYGHTLFLSRPEADLLLENGLPEGSVINDESCPFQIRGLCTARERRPLGCRVYFCDPNYAGQGERLTEQYIAELKRLHEESGEPWDYRPLVRHLERWSDEQA